MSKHINLLEGHIFTSLVKLALPIMGTSLLQMAYNMIDMIWIGRVGSNAVAAVGAAGMFMWMAETLVMLGRMGGQIKVGQLLGAKRPEEAASYAQNAFQMSLSLALLYTLFVMGAADHLIGFFKLNLPETIGAAEAYLRIVSLGTLFSFANQLFTGMITATGNSHTPFMVTTVGLILNIIMDPVLIFVCHMGVEGAAIATVGAQAVVTVLFLCYAKKDAVLFQRVRLFRKPDFSIWGKLASLGAAPAVQTLMFSGISMVIARMIAGFGDAAVAVQKVGSQIESISWMTADGFGAAVNSFVAQNYGSGNLYRAKKGYQSALGIMVVWGILSSCLLIFFPEPIFRIFIEGEDVIPMGVEYLSILGISQLFMCIESVAGGAFGGMGNTFPPSFVSVTLTAARIPMAAFLSTTALGLCGVWWSISISSILKGITITIWFYLFMRRKLHKDIPAGQTL